jgi:hypothetical protein
MAVNDIEPGYFLIDTQDEYRTIIRVNDTLVLKGDKLTNEIIVVDGAVMLKSTVVMFDIGGDVAAISVYRQRDESGSLVPIKMRVMGYEGEVVEYITSGVKI